MKYNYDKKLLKDLGVGPFLKQIKHREEMIDNASAALPTSIFNANILAKKLHPDVQFAKIAEVIEHQDAKSYRLIADSEKGTEKLAYFRAGQYVSIAIDVAEAKVNRPFTIRSCPKQALQDSSYWITVKQSPNGFASKEILDHWEVGTKVTMSGPVGEFYHQELRDAKHVVALAGGSGITPFYSMAEAIVDGTENFDLTIIYGSRKADEILLKEELEDLAAKSNGKVKVIHVISDEQGTGFEHGFITAEIVKKYAPKEDYSIFICGPKAMYKFLNQELKILNLKPRRIREEVEGDYGDPTNDADYPAEAAGKTYQLTVIIRGESKVISCKAEQTLLDALEKAGIRAPSHCRSGDCGWCHARLVEGKVHIPAGTDGRRLADIKFGWIHPCCSYPISDVILDVPVPVL